VRHREKLDTPVIKGFEHVNRYWDPNMGMPTAKILPGECYVSNRAEMIVTVLGSCISACIRDVNIGVGGMNHFMLPVQGHSKGASRAYLETSALCYGNWAMEFLINEILKQGGQKRNLEVKLFGGGKVLSSMDTIDVGERNINFVQDYLKKEGLKVVAMDLGCQCPRKVLYFSDTGAVKLKRLRVQANNTIEKRERDYIDNLRRKPNTGEVELF